MKANAALPMMEMIAGRVNMALEGSSAMMTPTNPIAIAVQRRQPTRSPNRNGESAAT